MQIEMLAIVLLMINYAASIYLMHRFNVDLDTTTNRIIVVGAYTLNAFLAVYTPVVFVALFALWVSLGLFIFSWILIHERA